MLLLSWKPRKYNPLTSNLLSDSLLEILLYLQMENPVDKSTHRSEYVAVFPDSCPCSCENAMLYTQDVQFN